MTKGSTDTMSRAVSRETNREANLTVTYAEITALAEQAMTEEMGRARAAHDRGNRAAQIHAANWAVGEFLMWRRIAYAMNVPHEQLAADRDRLEALTEAIQ